MGGDPGACFSAHAEVISLRRTQLRSRYYPTYGFYPDPVPADVDQEPALDDEDAAVAAADGTAAREIQGQQRAAAKRDGRSLQAQSCQPARRMRPDGAAAADIYRALRSAAELGRAPACAVYRLDQGSLDSRLRAYLVDAAVADGALSRAAGPGAADGREQLPPAIHDSDLARSESTEDDDADSADFHDHADKL